MDITKYQNLMDVLIEIGDVSVNQYRNSLLSHGHSATGNLAKQLSYTITKDDTIIKVIIKSPNLYWQYVEFGRNPFRGQIHPDNGNINYDETGNGDTTTKKPSMPNLNALIDWIIIKGLTLKKDDLKSMAKPNPNLRGTKDQQTLAYLIGRSIKEKGIKPDRSLYDIREFLVSNYNTKINNALKLDIENEMNKILNDIK